VLSVTLGFSLANLAHHGSKRVRDTSFRLQLQFSHVA